MIYLLLLYIVILIAYGVYSIAGIYHLWRFGYVGDLTKPVIYIYILASLLVVGITFASILWYSAFSSAS